MNDPLRDNRTFPEEMQQQPEVAIESHRHFSWAWFLVIAAILIALVYFVFLRERNTVPNEPQNISEQEFIRQKEVSETIRARGIERTEAERNTRIELLFGNPQS